MTPVDTDDPTAWLVRGGLAGLDEAALLDGFCRRLAALGVPLSRASAAWETLHPLSEGEGFIWRRGQGVRRDDFGRGADPEQEESWLRSPFHRLVEARGERLRRRLDAGRHRPGEFPILDDLHAEGATDYLARIVYFGSSIRLGTGEGLATSWTADRPGGFADDELAAIERHVGALALAFRAVSAVGTARTLMTTYLGRDAGERVLRGEIERGRVQTLRAVLWFSDLRNFTRIADTVPRDRLLALLSDYSDVLVSVVHDHGGQVLKFMGDGQLAIFVDDDDAAGCGAALDAAEAAQGAVDDLNARRAAADLPVTGFTLALHVGEVFYGNVGSRDRLDFTVVGPAVNETSRIAAMCRVLDQPVIVSSAFAGACAAQSNRLVSLGRYALRGVRRPQELFTLDAGD